MTTVSQLKIGDVVALPGDARRGIFVGRSVHPTYVTLQAVTWRMSNGEWFIDALSPNQDIGDVVVERMSIDSLLAVLDGVPVTTQPDSFTPGRWWQVIAPDGSLWCETSVEAEARDRIRPGDTLLRLYERTEKLWRIVDH